MGGMGGKVRESMTWGSRAGRGSELGCQEWDNRESEGGCEE